MEEFSREGLPTIKNDKKNLLMTSKDPHLSHLFGDEPKTPNSIGSSEHASQSVMDDSRHLHDEETKEPEYRLFEEQSYVPDLSPSNQMMLESNSSVEIEGRMEATAHSSSPHDLSVKSQKLKTATGSNSAVRSRASNVGIKLKPFICKEEGCKKAYSDPRSLHKHVLKFHTSDVNNNSTTSSTSVLSSPSKRVQTGSVKFTISKPTSVITNTAQQTNFSPTNNNQKGVIDCDFSSNLASSEATAQTVHHNGSSGRDQMVDLDLETNSDSSEKTSSDNSNYNMQLLAHSAQQHLLQQQNGSQQVLPVTGIHPNLIATGSGTSYLHQSSNALQQLAIHVQMRESNLQGEMSAVTLSSETGLPVTQNSLAVTQQSYLSTPRHFTGIRAQLRKSLSHNGKLESKIPASHSWPRMNIPSNLIDSGTMSSITMPPQTNIFLSNVQQQGGDINTPLLKDLLASRMSSNVIAAPAVVTADGNSNMNLYVQKVIPGNSWPGEDVNQNQSDPMQSPNLQSPAYSAPSKQTVFSYAENSPDPNPSPLNSPTYSNAHPFQSQHNQTTPLPHNEQQFFSHDNIMVNNNNNQQVPQHDTSSSSFNEMIAESENFVQDLIDEATAGSNHESNQQMMPTVQNPYDQDLQGPIRVTPPPAYHLNPHTGLITQGMTGQTVPVSQQENSIYLTANADQQIVKTEPQSPLITSPMCQRMFFNPQNNGMSQQQSGMQSLSSPTIPHQQGPMQPGIHPTTPTADAQWQFPVSANNQSYQTVPQSPTADPSVIRTSALSSVKGQDIIESPSLQNVRFLNHPRAPVGNTKPSRVRRSSGGSGRKNPDGTLSCSICGHSFRSVPALNGHMRVHSSSSDKKSKDERQRKTSCNNTGSNTAKQVPTTPTTPTYPNSNTTASMYHNPSSFNNVTLPAFTNSSVLYNTNMDSAVASFSQHESPRKTSIDGRYPQQNPAPGIYSYTIPHPPAMHRHEALFAAVNLLSRSEGDLTYNVNQSPDHADYSKVRGPHPPIPDLHNIQYLAQHQSNSKLDLPSATQGMILIQQPVLPTYLHHPQAEQAQGTSIAPAVPFVNISSSSVVAPLYRPNFTASPQQEQQQAQQFLMHQSLTAQPNHRSTPLADFADIAVAHNQGQLFCPNSMLVAPLSSNQGNESLHSLNQQQEQQQHQLQLQDVSSDIGLLASVSKDLLWRPDSQPSNMVKLDREEGLPLKDEDFMSPSIQAIRAKSHEQIQQQEHPNDPFIFPVSIPVQCSRDDNVPPTSGTMNNFYSGNFDQYQNVSAFHDDPLMQEAINVANPSKILPNSMMGGTPSGPSFRSFRQRHHSEGSVLKKILPADLQSLQLKTDLQVKTDISSFVPLTSKSPSNFNNVGTVRESNKTIPASLLGEKRKLEKNNAYDSESVKKSKLDISSEKPVNKCEPEALAEKKEIWTVPKQIPPVRTRHRRHSADGRVPYRMGSLLSRSGYHSSFSSAGIMSLSKSMKGTQSRHRISPLDREKRRPPPLIIPPSVNAFTNGGTLYTSNLHHRRRPSGDSANSCGNDKIPPYTPPPMLSPMRLGSGLYCTTPVTPSLKPIYRQGSAERGIIPTIPEEEVEDEVLVRSADPKINIGPEYQTELPTLRPRSKAENDVHNADLVWKPPPELEKENSPQSKHVEEYLKLACSAAVPFGGCNKEYALHLLHKNGGDILASVQQLLTNKAFSRSDDWMVNYKYTGSTSWSAKERNGFEQSAMQQHHHHKDFYTMSKLVKTMMPAQCVEYYYHTVKRRKRRIQRPRRFRHDSEDEEIVKHASSPNSYDSYLSEDDFIMQEQEDVVHKQETADNNYQQAAILQRTHTSTAFVRANPHFPPPALINHVSPPKPFVSRHVNNPVVSHHRPQLSTATLSGLSNIYACNVPSCHQSFTSAQRLLQHQQTHKTMKPAYLERIQQASPSPASSPASGDTDAPAAVFACPRCGKTFAKVKSRNAHMKTHGKHAQEKRKQKEEEARRKMEEAAAWRNQTQQRIMMSAKPPIPGGGGKGRDLLTLHNTDPSHLG